jgi:hypothetical protein
MLSWNGNLTNLISTFVHKLNAKIKPQKMTKWLYVKFYVYHPLEVLSLFLVFEQKLLTIKWWTSHFKQLHFQSNIYYNWKDKHRKKEMCVSGFEKFVGTSIGTTNGHWK